MATTPSLVDASGSELLRDLRQSLPSFENDLPGMEFDLDGLGTWVDWFNAQYMSERKLLTYPCVTVEECKISRQESLENGEFDWQQNESEWYERKHVRKKHLDKTHTQTLKEGSRKGLPLIFELDTGKQEVMTGHDTSTEANHMSLELAQKLGYQIDTTDAYKAQFQLPNGKRIQAIGRVSAKVQFAQGAGANVSSFTCFFNVFSRLALPALIGMAFLNATKTLTIHRSRLATLPAGWKRSLRLCAVGNATNQVSCLIDGRPVKAVANIGTEIALASGQYAMRNGLLREYSCEELELADVSREYTFGFADVELTVPVKSDYAVTGRYKDWMTKTVRIHVLKNLHFDLILDE